ncbi:acyl-CoA carboxylase subunit epsilon [Streptomyces sulphureus]|uniref:acyl-CoA carboxylase subunit epsilon n=1 Tax=Streptomyces sulphureus TaxID=47758 RepID=UPI0003789B4B|nr:acyl-CoA carboxylase subunit epsilon [Streptomyces sulphureus]
MTAANPGPGQGTARRDEAAPVGALMRVVRGHPTAEELAAVVACLTVAASRDTEQHPAHVPSEWARSARRGLLRSSYPMRGWRTARIPHR